jgi:S1-C subfamily serine protease
VNLVDAVVVVVVVLAAVQGARAGAVALVLAYAGFFGGLLAGAAAAPWLSARFQSSVASVLIGLAVPLLAAGLGSWVGQLLGWRAALWWHQHGLWPIDAVAGSVVSGAASLLLTWLVGFLLAAGPWPAAASEIQGSAILRRLDRALPAPPTVLARIQSLLDRSGFPPVFAGLEPDLAAPVTLPSDPVVRAAVERAGASTVRIVGAACGGLIEGSGFVGDADLVVTNAHVVAGVARPFVEDGRGRHAATPLLFDPGLDVAVLRVTNLAGPPLALDPAVVPRGTEGTILGYPGGGPFRASPAAVRRESLAVGRDIYGQRITTRAVYELQSQIRPGNSGGPLVGVDGRVLGVVFSRSVRDPNVGYALVAGDVAARLRDAKGRTARVGTGSCAE